MNNVSKLVINAIKFGAHELSNNSQRNSLLNLIVLSNSLHLIPSQILSEAE